MSMKLIPHGHPQILWISCQTQAKHPLAKRSVWVSSGLASGTVVNPQAGFVPALPMKNGHFF